MAGVLLSSFTIQSVLSPLVQRLLPQALLGWDFLGGFLLATPKKRTTHRTKRIKLAPKWLKPMKNIQQCPICGADKLIHHICPKCLKTLKQAQ
ncbi:hypothetical protein BATDEDRAFT_91204 [Batrachochytrium dendrobatidis JAM81]|uniref:Large ribosomal subunit protein bL32m n=1 Tax=Batrachochytrium dendrobatidis (strain JAM81 / FGSC 10211) TaxID=684364 RepID=F4P9W5_BATDJ|nr:uncharacterized protein BATDEDRAFT_91204 [Batrachochytrium dendrobatidis JAM81]EGF78013.1 hypothetical protein BATDEDRAFT_91204 [Batrachochytrium dendrobatidis JAM81]KAJ8330129.1 hypothetical protein O5D80_001701 [Batrachochytrium dendrobatidis]KAK5670453.1 hypothetical protein QVD99_003136 [Batrachochytrium dendrobatidis]|eukprot:XP_006681547.1 hypothetical protein BATDEDRAFT_91204 [Batrachochytrium dendrobatidis JAM81]